VSIAVVPVERRRDGKLHPPGGRLSEQEHDRAVTIVHRLHCRDGLSFRATRKALESYGIRRSLGSVYTDLTAFECDRCADQAVQPAPEPEPPRRPPERPWHGGMIRDGYLTSQVRGLDDGDYG
jgi:hypothetical protein